MIALCDAHLTFDCCTTIIILNEAAIKALIEISLLSHRDQSAIGGEVNFCGIWQKVLGSQAG